MRRLCLLIFPFAVMLVLAFIFVQLMSPLTNADLDSNSNSNSENVTMSDLIDPAEPFKETTYFKDADFNVTILDKKYHHSAILSDDYEVIYHISENGDIRTTDDMKTYYSVEIGKTYPASFNTKYKIGSNKLLYIGSLNKIKA